MKQTKTTLKELNAMYRAVLRHGILCNAIALGLIATATPAMAVRDVNSVSTWNTALLNGGESSLSADILNPRAVSGEKQFDIIGNNHTITGGVSGTPTFVAEQNAFKFHYVDTDGTTKDLYVAADGVQRKTSDASLLVGAEVFSDAGLSESVGTVGYVSSSIFGIEERKTVGSYSVDTDFGVVKQEPSKPTSTSTYYTIKLINAETNDVLYVSAYKKIQDGYTAEDVLSNSTLTFRADANGSALSGVVLNSHDAGTAQITKYDNLTGTVFLSDPHAEYTVGDRSIYVAPGTDINSATDAYVSAKFNTSNQIGIKNNGLVLNLPADTTSTISDITMKDFSSTTNGGVIVLNSGELSVSDSTFTGNSTTENGGAIYNEGTLTLDNATLAGNSASYGYGGAIRNTGTLTINNSTFGGATSADANSSYMGGAIDSNGGNITLDNSVFNGNTSVWSGGAVNGWYAGLTVQNGSQFINNTTTGNDEYSYGGGAIFVGDSTLDIADATFSGNASSTNAGAVYKSGSGNVSVKDSVFTKNTATGEAGIGGAVVIDQYNTGTVLFDNVTFGDGTATGANHADEAGAIWLGTAGTIENSTFNYNTAHDGGAVVTGGSGQLTLNNSTFLKNVAEGNGGAIATRKKDAAGTSFLHITGDGTDATMFANNSAANGGAIYTGTNDTTITNTKFVGNTATANGGAIYNEGTLTLNSSTFTDNTAVAGGAIYNDKGTITANGSLFKSNNDGAIHSDKGTITLTDTSFKNNTGENFGAIGLWNGRNSVVTINAQDADVVFSGNTATDGEGAGDIYNSRGTINLNAANGKTISMDGGIVGAFGNEKLNINSATGNTGVVDIAANIENHTVNVDAGELHLSKGAADGSNLTDSTVNVASGATINTIDNLVNNYVGSITLSDGALVKGDIDYTAGLADKYSADSGANITYKLANALNLSGVQYGSKEIAITNTGATVNADVNFAWFNGDTGLTLTSGGTGTGTVLVSGVAGGINAAVDATDDTVQEVNYALNGNDTFTGTTDNVIQKADFTITGNGNDADADKIVFGDKDMIVDGNSTLTLNDVVLEKTNDEAIVNQKGATLNIKDSRIAVNVNNYGKMVSDPTYYDAKVVNAGDATFTEDVFENGSSLINSAIVNLNNVEFASESTLTGLAGNVLNVAGADNKFNGTSTGNNVVLANGANFVGTLSDGVVDARNGGIDTITGSVSGGDLYVDANLNAGTVDTFGGTTGATVKGIKLAGTAYGDDDKVKLTIGEAALDSDVEIDGTNYFTSVVKDGNDIVFSDKLINESNLYNKLGSWTSGNYIKSNVDMANPADTDHLTVGSALAALDTAIGDMSGFGSQNYAKNTGSVAANITALDTQLKTVSTEGEIASGNTGFVSGGAVYTALADKQDTLTAGSVALDKLATTDLSQFDNSTSGFITKDVNDLANYTTTSDMTDAITTAKDAAISAAATDATTKANQALADAKTYADGLASNYDAAGAAATAKSEAIAAAATDATTKANQALADAQAYIDGKGYQNATQVGDAIDTKIANLDLANTYEAKGAAATAETNAKAYADSLASNYDAAGAAATAETNAKAYADSLASNYDAAGAAATAETNAKSYVDTKLADYTTTADMNTAIAGKQDAIVDNAFIVTDGAGGLKVADASVTDAHLAANAVTTAKVADGAITTVKVADGAITSDKLDSGVQASLTKANNAVQTVSTGTTDGTITVDGTEVAVAGWNTKQDAISNTSTIVADGTGLKVADGSIGATQLDSSVNASLTKANNSVQSVTTGSSNGTINVDGTDVAVAGLGSLAYEDAASFETAGAAATAEANAKAYTDARLSALHDNSVEMANAYTDKRIESLDKNLSAGVAGAVALSAVATSGVERGEVSVGAGYGYFNGQSAAAFGATMGLTNRWSINAGAGISNADVSFRAGTNYKFKLF